MPETQKQFTLFSHSGGPNPVKVAILLNELGLTYDEKRLDFQTKEHKSPEFTKINPNGRVPALVDHVNGDFAIWESNAILLYLVDTYDKENRLTVTDPKEKALLNQWLFFQASGQGPYFGQLFWFLVYHGEKLPSAIERYKNEILRVWSVLESVLSKQDWLVGGKLTIADLSFIPWNKSVLGAQQRWGEDFKFEETYPAVAAWHKRLSERDSVKVRYEQK